MGITRINTNITALSVLNNVNRTGDKLAQSIERLSSGLRINSAADDAAGLSVASNLETQVRGLNVAVDNAQSGINVLSVAEGALVETGSRLNRIRELAIQAANTGVYDYKARLSIQDEVFQSIDEITRIANTTQFGDNFLLNGDFSIKTEVKAGQIDIGVNVDASPVGSSLGNGTSFLNIQQIQTSSSQIVGGDEGSIQILNTGIKNLTDIAVTLAHFGDAAAFGGSGAVATDAASATFFNGVSISAHAGSGVYDVFTFDGVLADGVTKFSGSLSLSGQVLLGVATDTALTDAANSLIGSINRAIDQAEKALFGATTTASVPTSFRTTVSLGAGANMGRLLLFSDGNYINQGSININLVRNSEFVTQSNGVTRSGAIGTQSSLSGVGQVGNSVTAITGSTFGTGQFEIEVTDVQQALQRTMESNVLFQNNNGALLDRSTTITGTGSSNTIVLNGNFAGATYTGGTTLQSGDTITITGANADGTTFKGVFSYDDTDTAGNQNEVDTNLNDFSFRSISGLIAELNYRTRDYNATNNAINTADGVQTRFEDALFTYTTSGTIQLVDDYGRSNSQTAFTITFQSQAGSSNPYTIQDDADLTQEGYAEQASFRIGGGETVRAEAGEVITLKGVEATIPGVPQEEVTFRVGSGFSAGTDTLETTANLYIGRLNGGADVTFSAGAQDVVFNTPGSVQDPSKYVTIDFDSIIDVTTDGSATDPGRTVLLSTVSSGLNFQIGAFSRQDIQFSIGDLKSDNLGYGRGSGRTVQDIDVTSLSGANEALDIIDEALDQVNRTRSILGAATNRLESTVSNLSVTSENLTASESRIRDADIASETTEFTLNQVLLQAGISVLAQSNFQSQGFLALLG